MEASQKNASVVTSQKTSQIATPPPPSLAAGIKLEMVPMQDRLDVKEGLASDEAKTGLFKNKYIFKAQATAFDWSRLTVILDTLSTRLLDWLALRGSAAKGIQFLVITRAENFPKVLEKIKVWSEAGSGKFLKKHGLHLVLRDINTGTEQTSKISW